MVLCGDQYGQWPQLSKLVAFDLQVTNLFFSSAGFAKKLARRRGISMTDEDLTVIDHCALLSAAQCVRLSGYHAQLSVMDDKPLHFLVNVSQSPEFCPIGTESGLLFPTLTRNSYIVDIGATAGSGRIVLPLEHLAAMCFPVPMSEDEAAHGKCPFPALFLGDDEEELRVLSGNGMHCAAIGTWMQFVLAVFQFTDT